MNNIIKTIAILLVCTIFCIPGAYSQSTQDVTIHLQDGTLKQLFRLIEDQTSYRFSYDKDAVDDNHDLILNFDSKPVSLVLDEALKNRNINYSILSNNTIVIKPQTNKSSDIPLIKVNGTITDDKDEPIIGATIRVKNSDKITVSDAQGQFDLNVPQNSEIEVSYIGYSNYKIKPPYKSPLHIVMTEDQSLLDEVVVVGYGVQKKVNLTGSVGTVDAKDLENRPVKSVTDALQGRIPGLTVQSGTGEPGTFSTYKIRGNTSVNAGGALVIIDGVPGDINLINPQDIESISVLKDAASAAIYGARAAEGVILVTTRKAEDSRVKVDYYNNFAFNRPTRLPKSNTGYDHAVLQNQAYINAGLSVNFPQAAMEALLDPNITAIVNGNDWIYTANTDWISMMFDNSFQQTHDLAISKASESVQYRFSVGYLDQDGMFSEYGPDNYDRFTFRSNVQADLVKNILSLDSKISFTYTDRKQHPQFGAWTIPYITMIQAGPNMPIYDPNGNYARYRMQANPIQALREGGTTTTKNQLTEGIFTLSFTPIKGLTFKAVGAARFQNTQVKQWRKQYGKYGPDGLISMVAGQSGPNRLTQDNSNNRYITGQILAEYNLKYKQNTFYLLGGWSSEQNSYDNLGAERTNIVGNELPSMSLGSTDEWSNWADETDWSLLSGFMRFNYNFDEKYLFEANFRADASSRFSKKHRWGFFPSFSVGWRISQENFMKNQTVINNLKIRASWGQLGNQNGLGLYDHIAKYEFGGYYPFAGELAQWAKVNSLPSEERTWETVESTNIGLDMGFFDNRLTAEAEIFYKHTKNMLVSIEIPSAIGINVPTGNYGELKVKGWNFSIGWKDKIDKFSYAVNFSLSDQNDKLTDYGVEFNGFTAGLNQRIEGYSLGSIFGYKTAGYFTSQEEVNNSAVFNRAVTGPGDIKYVDIDGDGKISAPNDIVYLGSAVPRYVFGISLSANWNGIDFSTLIQGVGKRNFYLSSDIMAPFRDTWGNFSYVMHNDYWTPENPDAANPRPYAGTSHNYQISDHWLQNAAYVRLKNLQIGYTFPKKLINKAYLSNLRIYFSADNLCEFSKLQKDFDPELTDANGYIYPLLRSYSFGINLSF